MWTPLSGLAPWLLVVPVLACASADGSDDPSGLAGTGDNHADTDNNGNTDGMTGGQRGEDTGAEGSDGTPATSSDGSDSATTDPTAGDPTEDGSTGDRPPTGGDGCGVAFTGNAVTTSTISVSGQQRGYILSVPEGYDPDQPTSLVFAWHGLGGSGALARSYFGVEEQANGQAIFVYADGLPTNVAGGQTGWAESDVALFDALLADISSRLCIDTDRIFSIGHSFGGYMTHMLACRRSDVIRGIGVVAGGTIANNCESSHVAAWMTHGQSDQVVGVGEGQTARDQILSRNSCDSSTMATDPDPCVAYDGCNADYPVHWCLHNQTAQGGHLWPSFAAGGIWDFFTSLDAPARP